MADITFLHTSPAHVATFDALRDCIAPNVTLHHRVRTDWLDRARADGLSEALIGEISEAVAQAVGAVLCTCTTIGVPAQQVGAIRIDAPMMQQAAATGQRLLMAYALESTRAPSLAMLEQAVQDEGSGAAIRLLDLARFWRLFEAGALPDFAASLADAIRQDIAEHPVDCVVLAQASMAAAAPLLSDLGIPVLSSPEPAFRAALRRINPA